MTKTKMATEDEVTMKTFSTRKHSPVILEHLFQQKKEKLFCDVILCVDTKRINAHSNVLSAASPYFEAFLGRGSDNPRTFSQKTPQIIKIMIDWSGEKSGYIDAVSMIVDFMYTGEITLKSNIISQVNEIATILKMDTIIDFCKSFHSKDCGDKTDIHSSETQTDFQYLRSIGSQTELEECATPTKSKSTPIKDIVNQETSDITSKFRKAFPKNKVYLFDVSKHKPVHKSDDTLKKTTTTVTKCLPSTIETTGSNSSEPIDSTASNNVPTNIRFPQRKNRGKLPLKFVHGKGQDAEMENDQDKNSSTLRKRGSTEPYPVKLFKVVRSSSLPNEETIKNGTCIKEKVEGKIYRCGSCNFTTKQKETIQVHIKEHSESSVFCKFCDIEAENMEALAEHQQIHQPPLRYHCLFCGNKYKNRGQLNVHLPKHLDAKPFVCEICKVGFKWKHSLRMHMKTHNATKDLLCDVCGFRTSYRSQLKAHKRIHTGETFKCEYPNCKFQCIKRQSLKYHRLTHTNEKPFQCEICGQSFSLVKNLKRHALLHTDKRPYKCTVNSDCSFATTRDDKLKDHMLKIHGYGQAPKRRLRLCDYPKSLVPPPEHERTNSSETPYLSEIIHIDSSKFNIEQLTLNGVENKIYIQQPDGEVCPVTLIASNFNLPPQLITKLDS